MPMLSHNCARTASAPPTQRGLLATKVNELDSSDAGKNSAVEEGTKIVCCGTVGTRDSRLRNKPRPWDGTARRAVACTRRPGLN